MLVAIVLCGPQGFGLTQGDTAWLAWMLVALAALVALSGSPSRLPGSWLWLLGAAPAAAVVGRLSQSPVPGRSFDADVYLLGYAALLLAVVVTCWLVTDARPAFALSIAVLLTLLQYDTSILVVGGPPAYALVVLLPVAASGAIALGVLRLLRRRAAPAARPLP